MGWSNYQVVNWHKCCRGIWDIVTDSRIVDVEGKHGAVAPLDDEIDLVIGASGRGSAR